MLGLLAIVNSMQVPREACNSIILIPSGGIGEGGEGHEGNCPPPHFLDMLAP